MTPERTGLVVATRAHRLGLASIRPDGQRAEVGANRVLRLAPGFKVAVNLRDLTGRARAARPQLDAGSQARFYLIGSQVVDLGSAKISSQGVATGQLPIPANLAPGRYVLQVNAFTASRDVVSLSLGVVVVEPKPWHDGKGGTFTSAVYFKRGEADLSPQMKKKLRTLVAGLPDGVTVRTEVVGFRPTMDATPQDRLLAKERAFVTQEFLAALGVPGEIDVRADGLTSYQNWRGQRVVVTITYS